MYNQKFFVLLLGLISATQSVELTEVEQPTVCADQVGCMRGIYMPGYQTERFEAFLGIPYALPPINELRFSHPKAYPKWSGVYNATEAKHNCIQKDYLSNRTLSGNEDCLYLNVYRPTSISATASLPVLVYIHGGGFFAGSTNPNITGAEYFMDTREVIVVIMAYRLGALGFLSTGDQHMPGNLGLKDQNLALRWVQKHIAAFGGDSRQVTLMGQSAGSVAVHMHMISKLSVGLFRNAIAISGTANVPFAINENPLEQARQVAVLCNITNAHRLSNVKLARELRAVDVATLMHAGDDLKFWDVDHLVNYRPIVERTGKDAFLTEHPKRALATGNYKPVPWLAGRVPGEGAVRVIAIMENATLRNSLNENFDFLFQTLLELPAEFNQTQQTAKAEQVINEYLLGQHQLNNQTVQGFLDIITDRGFAHPLYNVIGDYVRTVDTEKYPIYTYHFNYTGPYSYANTFYSAAKLSQNYGVVHADDLIYLLKSPLFFSEFERNSTYAQAIQTMVNYFVYFAKNSKPLGYPPLRSCNQAEFEKTPNTICEYHEFVNSPSDALEIIVQNKFNVDRMRFWQEILQAPTSNRFSFISSTTEGV